MRVGITNSELIFDSESRTEDDALEDFQDDTSFFVKGAWMDPDYKRKLWDGREYLVQWHPELKRFVSPVGLLGEAMLAFDGLRVLDARTELGERMDIRLDPKVIPSLRPYQERAKKAALRDRGVRTGKGLLRLPTRSGKTVIAASIIAELGLRALFIVNSDMLLRQTVRFFEKVLDCPEWSSLPPSPDRRLVGQYGGGVKEPGWITVASAQGITRTLDSDDPDPLVEAMLAECDVCFFDEAHHLEANTWRQAMEQCDARYKIGLSATIYLSRDGGTARGTIWLVGATGPVLYSISPSELIDMGWLCTPEITFHTAPAPAELPSANSSFHTQYRVVVVENAARNAKLADVVAQLRETGHRVLVTATQIKHANLIADAIRARGLTCNVVTGKVKADDRTRLCDEVKDRKVDALVGTVFGEAVDLPFLEAVVVADGLASKVLTMQRLRNLTPVDENDRPRRTPLPEPMIVPVIEFADFASPMMAKHALARLQTYREHERFIVRWQDEEERGEPEAPKIRARAVRSRRKRR